MEWKNVCNNCILKKKKCGRKNKNQKLKESTRYVSLFDHPPIIGKKPLVGGESILRGNKRGNKII